MRKRSMVMASAIPEKGVKNQAIQAAGAQSDRLRQ